MKVQATECDANCLEAKAEISFYKKMNKYVNDNYKINFNSNISENETKK